MNDILDRLCRKYLPIFLVCETTGVRSDDCLTAVSFGMPGRHPEQTNMALLKKTDNGKAPRDYCPYIGLTVDEWTVLPKVEAHWLRKLFICMSDEAHRKLLPMTWNAAFQERFLQQIGFSQNGPFVRPFDLTRFAWCLRHCDSWFEERCSALDLSGICMEIAAATNHEKGSGYKAVLAEYDIAIPNPLQSWVKPVLLRDLFESITGAVVQDYGETCLAPNSWVFDTEQITSLITDGKLPDMTVRI